MEMYTLKNDIRLLCVTARSFPYGMAGAFAALERLLPQRQSRVFLGLLYKNTNGTVHYRAAAPGTCRGRWAKQPTDTFVLPRGEYWGKTLPRWQHDETDMAHAFTALLAHPHTDTAFPCVEWYTDCHTVTCMVRMHPLRDCGRRLDNTNHKQTNELC